MCSRGGDDEQKVPASFDGPSDTTHQPLPASSSSSSLRMHGTATTTRMTSHLQHPCCDPRMVPSRTTRPPPQQHLIQYQPAAEPPLPTTNSEPATRQRRPSSKKPAKSNTFHDATFALPNGAQVHVKGTKHVLRGIRDGQTTVFTRCVTCDTISQVDGRSRLFYCTICHQVGPLNTDLSSLSSSNHHSHDLTAAVSTRIWLPSCKIKKRKLSGQRPFLAAANSNSRAVASSVWRSIRGPEDVQLKMGI